MIEAALFRSCRKALGLSQPAIARSLLVTSDRTIRRWEQGEREVALAAWMRLARLLRDNGNAVLADRAAEVIEQRR
jgi:DNA-binding transcriptional regulator YiaG